RAQLALRHLPDRCLVQQRAFDASLLRWEVDHFRDWALDARGIRLSPGQGEAFDQAAGALSKQIGELPRGFVHRDYQSRNLMVRETPDGHRLTWIDFQDAMLGPRAYDLVALL